MGAVLSLSPLDPTPTPSRASTCLSDPCELLPGVKPIPQLTCLGGLYLGEALWAVAGQAGEEFLGTSVLWPRLRPQCCRVWTAEPTWGLLGSLAPWETVPVWSDLGPRAQKHSHVSAGRMLSLRDTRAKPTDRSVRPEARECVAQNQGHDIPPTARPKTGAALHPEVAEGSWSLNSKTTPTEGLAASGVWAQAGGAGRGEAGGAGRGEEGRALGDEG